MGMTTERPPATPRLGLRIVGGATAAFRYYKSDRVVDAGGGPPRLPPLCRAFYQPSPPVLSFSDSVMLDSSIPQALCVFRVDPPSRRRPLDHLWQRRARQRLLALGGPHRGWTFPAPLQRPRGCEGRGREGSGESGSRGMCVRGPHRAWEPSSKHGLSALTSAPPRLPLSAPQGGGTPCVVASTRLSTIPAFCAAPVSRGRDLLTPSESPACS